MGARFPSRMVLLLGFCHKARMLAAYKADRNIIPIQTKGEQTRIRRQTSIDWSEVTEK